MHTVQCFHSFQYLFLEKGVKVVRSPSEILALIKSCDNTTTTATDVPETIESPTYPKESSVVPLLQVPQNIQKKILKPIGPRRIFKPNLHVSAQTPEIECKKEIKETVAQPSNSLNSKKSVSGSVSYYLFINYISGFRYNVTWGKQTKKKHKTWEGDGHLTVHDKLATLYVIVLSHNLFNLFFF